MRNTIRHPDKPLVLVDWVISVESESDNYEGQQSALLSQGFIAFSFLAANSEILNI